uniref:Uncharacterized protein n=1 Tax=Vespula pensylvanica TaxID=30213 RepID=A0A834UFU4_VESPE|nr:hypothetical protein H0235_000035 [Vespula pensylvanica]
MKSSERVPQRVPVMDEGRSSYVHFVQRKMMNGPCRQEALEFRTEDNNTATDRVNSYGEDETKQPVLISDDLQAPLANNFAKCSLRMKRKSSKTTFLPRQRPSTPSFERIDGKSSEKREHAGWQTVKGRKILCQWARL